MVLFQGERTEEQKALFKLGLTASNVFYGHKDVAVWLQTEMPSGWAGATHAESGARAADRARDTRSAPLRRLL